MKLIYTSTCIQFAFKIIFVKDSICLHVRLICMVTYWYTCTCNYPVSYYSTLIAIASILIFDWQVSTQYSEQLWLLWKCVLVSLNDVIIIKFYCYVTFFISPWNFKCTVRTCTCIHVFINEFAYFCNLLSCQVLVCQQKKDKTKLIVDKIHFP